MTDYYFATRYSAHPQMRRYRDELEREVSGAHVTSSWIDMHGGELEASLTPAALSADPSRGWFFAAADLDDIDAADVLVSFTGEGGKGGRHVEHGYAMARGMRTVIVGHREHIFHTAPDTEVYASWQEFLEHERSAS